MAIKIPPIARTQDALDTPFDNSSNGFVSTDVQSAIEEIGASGNISDLFSRSGSVPANTWLLNSAIPSNVSGYAVALNSAKIIKIFISNQDATALTVGVYSHDGDGNNLTLLGTVTTAAVRSSTFTVAYSIAINKQIAVKLEAGSNPGKNMAVGCLIKGSTS